MNTYHPYYLITYPPPPHCVVLTPVPGGESGCSVIAGTLSPLFPVVTLSARRSGNCSPHMGTEIHWYFFIDPVRPSLVEGLGESQAFYSLVEGLGESPFLILFLRSRGRVRL